MIAGRLEIELMANVARLQQDMAAAKNLVGGAAREIERMASVARTALGAIGVGISVAGIAALTKASIDAMAKMKDLGIEAGTTAEAISRFDEPARKAGSSVEAVAGSIFKVSKAMIEARDPTSNAAQALKAIGLSAEQLKGLKSDEMFEKIARSVAQYSDGIEKNAVMQELFGKSGREMSRVVSEIAQQTKLAATVTNEEAEAADKLGDQMVELQMNSERLWKSIAAVGLPVLNEMLAAFISGTKQAGILQGAIDALSVAMGGDAISQLAKYNKQIQELESAWADALASGGRVDEPAMRAEIDRLRQLRDGLMSFIHAQELSAQSMRAMQGAAKGNPLFDPAKAAADAKAVRDAWTDAFNDLKQEAAELKKAYEAMGKLTEKLDKEILKDLDITIERIGQTTVEAANNGMGAWQQFADVWVDLSNRGAMFFQDLLFSGEKALDVLKRHLKSFLAELVAIFAKRWILQLGAGMPGMGALGAMAGDVGAGSVPGALMQGGSLLSGFSSLLPSGAMGGAFASGATGIATSLGVSNIGLLSTISNVASFIPVIGAVIGVATLLYQMFNDGPENPNFRLLQGRGGAGRFGGVQAQGNYDFNNPQLMGYVGNLDRRFENLIGPTGTAAATASLNAYTARGLRMDGQPAQMAFPEGDANAAEAIAKELLQSRYGILFEQIDAKIAEQIKTFAGTSTELQQFIEEMLGVAEGLSGLGIKGLDFDALRAMQREGETLGQTFTRVGTQWQQFNDLFTTEAERMDAARTMIADAFGDLGIAVPSSMDAFEELVRGLDLSTQAGRDMFDALMDIAPAFAAVSNATAAAVANIRGIINSITGNRGPSLSSLVDQFQAGNAWSSSLSDSSLISALLTITDADLANYSQAHRDLIGSILSAHQAMQSLGASTSSASAGLSAMGDGFNTTGDKSNLRDWVDQQLLDPSRSTLTADERFAKAQQDYMALLATANLSSFQGTGKAEAISKLQGAADTYLELARLMFGSSGSYNAIFSQVLSEVGKVGGMSQADVNARLYGALPTSSSIASSSDISSVRDGIYDLIMEVARGAAATVEASREGARSLVDEMRQTGGVGRLS